MKKLLVLSLVLGIASLATAGLDLTTDGSSVVEISFTVVDGNLEGYDLQLDAAGTVELGAATLSSNGTWLVAPVIHSSDATFIRITAGAFPGIGMPGLTANDIVLSVAVTGEGDVTMSNASVTTIGGSNLPAGLLDTVTIVPEPATMALLGLGALVLRRKK